MSVDAFIENANGKRGKGAARSSGHPRLFSTWRMIVAASKGDKG
jgi:hypothetical protein